MGIKPYTLLLGILFACISLATSVQAQDNLIVEYNGTTGVPNFLNICGESDTARITIRTSVNSGTEPRENIQATLNLFQGSQFVELLAAESDAGISLISSDLNTATFSIPNLDPNSDSRVDFAFTLRADCSFIDTINANNDALVFDTWDLSYDMDGSSLIESDFTPYYQDAFAVPNLTIFSTDTIAISSIGECFDRDVILSNSGLSGFIDSLNYSTTYGPGITVNSISINGIDYPLVKTPVGLEDTLYEATIVGVFMEQNTLGQGMGNGDQSLNPDESITVTENICILSCDENRESIHNVSWGCYGVACQSESITNIVSIGSGAPNPQFNNIIPPTIPDENTGYCKDGTQSIIFTNSGNEGDDGYGTMRDVELGIGLGNSFLLSVDKYEIFSVTIAGITITTTDPLVRLDQFAEFAVPVSDPNGTNGPDGLIDWDGDGFYDDLPINESIEISVGYRFVCSEANSTEDECENAASVGLYSRIYYTNACADRLNLISLSAINNPSNMVSDSESSTDTDATIGDGTFHVQYFQLRTVNNFDKSCSGGERLIVTVDLPTGITINSSETFLFRNGNPSSAISSTMNGTIVELEFDAHIPSIPNSIGANFMIDLGLEASCLAATGATSFPITFAHYCPDCDCTHTWYCGELDGPVLHPNFEVCNDAPPCPNGVRTLDFDVSRTTFGYTDQTYTNKVDPVDANTKVALSCDSVMMTVESVVGDDNITNDVGVVITYDNPEAIQGLEEIFLFDGAEVEIRQTNGNVDFCTVASSAITVTAIDLNKRLDIELDDCLATLGLTLTPNDTIIFRGMFSLNPDGPYNELFKLVPNFRGEMYHTFAGEQLSCDNYGTAFTIANTGSSFLAQTSFPEGCTARELNYSVAIFIDDFGTYYPNEFIPAAFTDSIQFSFDPAILDAFEDLSVEVRIPNHPIHQDTFFEIAGLDAFPNGEYLATFDTLTSIPSYNTSTSTLFTLRVNLIGNCGSETASSNGDNTFQFIPTIYYRDRIYAESFGDGSCASYIEQSFENSSITYTEPPEFSLQADSNPSPQVTGNQVQWIIKHCNESIESDAGLNWLALDIPNNSVIIESIQDDNDGVGPVIDIPFFSYGQGGNSVFAYVDPLQKISSSNPAEATCNRYIVTASFNGCGTFPLTVRTGWNCTAYDEPDWTPLDYAPCNEDTLNLSVMTLEGGVAAAVIAQPGEQGQTNTVDLCDTLTYEVLVRNIGLGYIFEMENQFFLPLNGMAFVPNSFELAYPPSSNDFNAIPDPVLEGITTRGESYVFDDFSQISPYLDANGLQGFNSFMPQDSNQYVVRFQVVSTCNFVSGDQLSYSFQGVSACGDSTNIEFGETLPIFIQDVPASNQFFLAEFGAASTYDVSGNGTLDISVTNNTAIPSDDNDVIRVILPLGTTYTSNSVVVNTPATWVAGEPTINIEDGFSVLYWDMPQNVALAETINFSFGFTGSPIPECSSDTLEFNLFTGDRYEIECGVTNEICSVYSETTEGGEQVLDLIITNGITIGINNAISTCVNDNTEELTVTADVTGLPTLTQDGTVTFYFDADMNGEVDPATDILLSTSTIPTGTADDFTVNETFNATNAQLCNIIMAVEIDVFDLGECEQPSPVAINPTLQNAGVSTNYCGNPLTIGDDGCGNINTYTYQWSAISPATDADISDLNILNPVLTVDPAIAEGTILQYVLETTRDGCGYASTDTIDVTILPNLTVTITPDGSAVVCDGESLLLTSTASETVSHQWSDGTNDLGANPTLTVSPTAATTYTVVVTNASGCSAMETIDITIGTGVTTIDAGTAATICLGSSIQLQGTATGGNGTLSYVWTGAGLDNSNIANPTATPTATTTYTLEVTDEDGCTQSDDVIITVDPDVPMATANDATLCVGLTTVLNASGGDNYTWTEMPANPSSNTLSANNIATPTFTPTITGTYNFEVLVAGGCDDVTVPVTVEVTSIQVTTPQIDLSQCDGDVQAVSITLEENIQSYTINGGPSQNDVSNGATLTFDAIYNQGANSYTIELTGVSGCTATTTFNFLECPCNPAMIQGVLVANSNCGESVGSATINISGNPADYTFTWLPNVGTATGNGESREDLPADTYEVTIEEIANPGCIVTTTVVIGNSNGPVPTSVTTTPATCNNNDGTATILPADWTYEWSDNGTGNMRTDLAAGIYGVTVTDPDDASCTNVITVIILEDNDLMVSHNVIIDPTCGNNDGSVEIIVPGGGTYTYIWSDGGTGAIRNDLSSGTYVVNIEEVGGEECSTTYILALVDSDVPQAPVTINEVINILCVGDANGSVDFTVAIPAGIANPVDTIITDGFTEWTNGSLAAGQYCIEIMDANGCVNGAACFEIESPEPIMANISTSAACSEGGSVTITTTGGTGIYTYDWADIVGTNNPKDRTNLIAGNYELSISDSNGCQMMLDGGITIPECPCDIEPEIESVIITEATCGNTDGEATIIVNPTSAGLDYTWFPDLGTPVGDGNIRTGLLAGGYTVTVSDPSGECFDVVTFAVNNEDGPELDTPITTTPADCGEANGTATLSPSTYNYAWSDGGTGDVRTDLEAGTYFVSISEVGNPTCFSVEEVFIGQNNDLEVIVNTVTAPTCGNADGTVMASTNGSGTYNYEWSFGGTAGDTQTNLMAGVYGVTATDVASPDCEASTTFVLIDGDVAGADVNITSITDVSCGGASDGMVNFTVTPQAGFQGPETVVIANDNGEFVNGSLSGGDYCIVVYDVNGCVAGGECFTIEENEPLDAEFSISGGCGADGSIDITITEGTGTYTFDWADLPGTSDPEDRDNLTTGMYNVTITDSDGCTITGVNLEIECEECTLDLDLESVVIQEATCGENDGEAIVNANVDLEALVFTWTPDLGTPGATGNIRTNLPAGGYIVEAVDTTGFCSDTISFVITNEDAPVLDADPVITSADCGTANGSVTLSPNTYDYVWSDNGTGAARTDLAAGIYFATFSDSSAPNCEGIIEIIVPINNTLEVTIDIVNAPTCGNADGEITANVTNGSGNYAYLWNTGGTTMNQTGLMSGTYSVEVTDLDNPECTATATITLVDSDVTTDYDVVINTITNVSCAGTADGAVDFSVTPNTGFTTTIVGNGTTYTNGTLPGGDYCVNVIDNNGCIAGEGCFTILESNPLEVEFSISEGCQDAGSIDLIITGGTGGYTFDWADLPGTNDPEDRTDLAVGTYSVSISDENGCLLEGLDLEVVCTDCDLDPVAISTVIYEATCGNSDGEVTINLNVDPSLPVYTWLPDVGTPGITGNIRTELPAGGYTVTVADVTGTCFDIVTFAVTNEDGPELEDDPVTTPADCDAANGTATLLPADYDYVWPDTNTGNTRTDLAAGVYFVTFTDSTNPDCEGVVEVIIGINSTLEVDIEVIIAPTCGNTDGEISANVTNGSGNYQYVWSFGGNSMTESGLESGSYAVTVTDLDNPDCTASASIVLINSDVTNIDVTINEVTDITCLGANDGSVDFTANIPAGFSVVITDGINTYENGSLPAGELCIEITDASNCVAGGICFEIEEPSELDVEFSISGGCEGDGAIDIITNGGTGNYTFDWADLPGTNDPEDRADLTVGMYSVSISDENGCLVEGLDLEIVCTDCDVEPEVVSTVIYEATCGNSDGEVTINLNVDPSLPVYTWSPDIGVLGATGNIRTELPAGGYTVTVSDSSGACFDVVTFAITNADGPELNGDPVTTPADCDAANGTATLLPADYNYVWPDTNTGNTRTDLAAGVYFVTFTDSANPDCEGVVEVIIGINSTLEVDIEVITAPTCGNTDGEISANVTNGSGNYQYAWSFGGNSMTGTSLESGSYVVTVTDLDNPDCTASASIILIDSDVTNIDVIINEVNDITCLGENDGFVDFTANIPVGFSVVITDGVNTYENGSLPAGELCIEITDDSDCVAGGACFEIEEPTELDIEFSISGGCAEDGAIDIIANGGTGNYTFDWADLPGTDDPEDRTDLAVGMYTVSISDENGCLVEGLDLEIVCTDCDFEPIVTSTVIYEATCGNSDGEVTINMNVDPSLPVYTWLPDVGTPGATGNIRTDLPAGGYTVTVADLTGLCFDIVTFAVTNEDAPTLDDDPVTTPADCDDTNGTATLLPANYDYVWPDTNTGNTRADLATGVYFVTFTDPAAPDCEGIVEVTIGINSTLEADIEIITDPTCGNADGEITVNATNGSGNYQYTWSFGGNNMTESGLQSGSYAVTVTDLDNPDCTASTSIVLLDSDVTSIDITIDSIANITCSGANDGFVGFTADIPTGFNVVITDGINTYENGSLPAGELCIEITDASNCVAGGACFEIEEPTELDVEFSISGGCADDGAINIIANGGTGNYTFDWLDLPGDDNIEDRTNLSTGVYSVIVSDENECAVIGFDLVIECDECEDDIIDYTIAFESVCGGFIGSAEVVVNGNTTDYTYDWTPSDVGTANEDGNKLTLLPAGLYQVVVTDTANTVCVDSVSILVTNEDGPEATIEIITPAGCGDSDGTATLAPDSLTYEWSDGGMGAIRDDLAAGTYEVIYYDDEDTICYNVLLVEIPDTSNLELEVEIISLPDCNMNNGSVNINLVSGMGELTFIWSDGGSGQNRDDLESGTYTVVALEEASGCSTEITFTLPDNVPETATINITEVINISCNGDGLGSVVFDVTYEDAFAQPAVVTVTDGFTAYDAGNLPVGSYCINVEDADGCLVASECFEITETEELALSIIGTYAGCEGSDELGSLDVTVTGGTEPYSFDWADLTDPNEPEDRTDLPAGIYDLTVTDALGCMIVADGIGLDTFCIIDCDYFGGMDTLNMEIACGDTLQVCTSLSYGDFLLGEYSVSLDGEPYDVTVEDVCESETLVGYNTLILPNQGNAGPYFVDSWEVDGTIYSGEYMTTMDLIDSMNTWNPEGNWMLGQQGAFIMGGVSGVNYGDLTIYVVSNPVLSATLTTNSIASSNNVGVNITEAGQHEVIIMNNETLCPDTLIVNISCMDYTLYDTITLGNLVDYCLDVTELIDSTDLMGNIVSLENVCPESSGTSVIFTIESEVPPCISYAGITPGTDTACLVLCDDLGICDTVNYIVTVIPTGPITVMDTVIVQEQDTICLDSLTDLCGDIVSIEDFCNDGSMIVDFDTIQTGDDFCIIYEGLNIGIDSSCWAVEDEYGNIDTVIIIITVGTTTPDTICDTIFVGQVVEYCIDQSELLTSPETIENICQDQSGEFIEFFADESTYCVTYEGVDDVGTDSACVVICDSMGVCDTTYFCITVVEFFDPPIAVDDIDTTMTNVPIVINVKENDTIFGGIDSIYVIDGPLVGEVTLNLDCTFTYAPDEGVCSITDSFTYVVCNPNACDTATVFIYIECTELTIFNGFSPNNDGVNDVFYIDGIEDFPNNRLCVYNRWGNKVYDKKGYNNEWFGTWSGNDLPDGTYFYVLDLGEENEGKPTVYNGYVQIHR